MPTLHIVIPVYNERRTLPACVDRVLAAALPAGWDKRLHLVDDASAESCAQFADELVSSLADRGEAIELLRHPINRGKGAALRTGFDRLLEMSDERDAMVVQDADLEYDPSDFAALLAPIMRGAADAVIGVRFGKHFAARGLKRRVHTLGNRALTRLSNLATGLHLHDMESCYKLMTLPTLRAIRPRLTEERFGIEPQMIAALARVRARVVEVPISYDPRGIDAGKKIGWRDGVRAVQVIVRERFRHSGRIESPIPALGDTSRGESELESPPS